MFPSNVKLDAPEVGDLKSIWDEVDSLPEPSGRQQLLNVLRRTGSGIVASWLGSLLTVTTISVTLFIVASFVFTVNYVEKYLARTSEQMTLSLYLSDQTEEKTVIEIVSQLESIPVVRAVRYRSKDDALRFFREEMQEFEAYLEGFDEKRNPLPGSLEVQFQEGASAAEDFQEIAKRFRAHPNVEVALYNQDFVVRFNELFDRFLLLGFLGVGFLILLSSWVIYNTIRFHAISRRDEIQVQRYMGATRESVQLPFLLEGGLFGLVGTLLAIFTLWIVVNLIHAHLIPEYLEIERSFLSLGALIMLIVAGTLVGTAGSWLAVRKIREL